MKRIFTVAQVKDESDIIESFCRYNLTYCDGMIIKDNGSSDNTKEIIQNLINEGLPIYFSDMGGKLAKAHKAIDEYGADLIIPLDADEFLYHIDGVNPRETLEALREDVEYQAIWRTYVYEKEPDIKLGFMPNNFTQYRNPGMENPKKYERHKKAIASKYLLKNKKAVFIGGSHFLVYPEEYQNSAKTKIHQKLVFAHFPIRSRTQIMKKTIPNWICKWSNNRGASYATRYAFDIFQLGVLFNEIRDSGEITPDKMKQYSIEYAMLLDLNISDKVNIINRGDLDKFKSDLGQDLTIVGSMNTAFCADKLKLRYTDYGEDNKAFIRATLKEIDSTVMFLSSESDERAKQLQEITQSLTQNCFLFFDTGSGYNENEIQSFSFTGNEVEISCQIPENTVAVRFDPVEGHGCVVNNLEILSYGGIVKYEPTNGYMDKAENLVFTNTDPQIGLHGASHWLKIKYRILLLSDFSHYRVLNNYLATTQERDGLVVERDGLVVERDGLVVERDGLVVERDGLVVERDGLVNSRSWRITKPLRKFAAFVRRNRVLYLFAKGLLSIKRFGIIKTIKKVVSYIKRRQLSSLEINNFLYESEYQENIDFSGYESKVKAIAFYLPQFHTIPENDKWWGKGFTEWKNTRKAKPAFKGHYQPREPHKDIGYYDLTNVETIRKQAALAKQHGIYGFCFYLYWFSGKRLLEKPLDLFLEHPEININFCLCWANENWSRRWDGSDQEILIKQNYSEEDPYRFIEDIQKYIVDGRYIKIDGIPIILVYSPGHITNVRDVFLKWRKQANEIGIGKIKILICKTFGNTARTLGIEDIIDGLVEFPPHRKSPASPRDIHIAGRTGYIFDYKEVVSEIIKVFKVTENKKRKSDTIPLYRTCMMSWDNAARKKDEWATFAGFSLKFFSIWTTLLVAETIKTKKSFFFVNAWNEWAEGTYLEPDKKYGYANINTLSKAICELPFDYENSIGQKRIKKLNNKFIKNDKIKICVQIHLYYLDLIDEIISNLNFMPFPFHCYISTDTDEKIAFIQNNFAKRCKNAYAIYIKRFENRGRDVAPFICQVKNIINEYDYILHIHTKRSLASDDYGDDWRDYLYRNLLGSPENIYRIFYDFIDKKKLGLIYPKTYSAVIPHMLWGTDIQQGKKNVLDFLERTGAVTALGDKPEFPSGNMFWARTNAIKKVFGAGLTQDDFPVENNQKDMTLAHAIERSWVYIARHEGYTSMQMSNVNLIDY